MLFLTALLVLLGHALSNRAEFDRTVVDSDDAHPHCRVNGRCSPKSVMVGSNGSEHESLSICAPVSLFSFGSANAIERSTSSEPTVPTPPHIASINSLPPTQAKRTNNPALLPFPPISPTLTTSSHSGISTTLPPFPITTATECPATVWVRTSSYGKTSTSYIRSITSTTTADCGGCEELIMRHWIGVGPLLEWEATFTESWELRTETVWVCGESTRMVVTGASGEATMISHNTNVGSETTTI